MKRLSPTSWGKAHFTPAPPELLTATPFSRGPGMPRTPEQRRPPDPRSLEGRLSGTAVNLLTGGAHPSEIEATLVVNAAGLDAWELSGRLEGLHDRAIHRAISPKAATSHSPDAHLSNTSFIRCQNREALVST